MESQRVKCLTEGYLRGWLDFNYSLSTSRIREELILAHIQEDRLYLLLQNKLFIETVLRSTSQSTAKDLYSPIYDISRQLIGLKLPSALPKGTIKDNKKAVADEELLKWKKILEQANKKKHE